MGTHTQVLSCSSRPDRRSPRLVHFHNMVFGGDNPGMNDITAGQKNAFVFGMNGSGMYGAQIFKDGDTIDGQWAKFGPTHKGMKFSANPAPYTSCLKGGDAATKFKAANPTQIANPVLVDGSIVRAGAWFRFGAM